MAELRRIFVLYVAIFCTTANGIINIDPEKKEKIDNFVNSLLSECDRHQNVAGLGLSIVHEGEIIYTTGYGVKNLGRHSVCIILDILSNLRLSFSHETIEFFTVCTKLAEIAILYSKDLTTAKKSYLQWGLT